MSTIKLRTNDGEIFEIDYELAKLSGTINFMLDLSSDEEEKDSSKETEPIPLPNINSDIFRTVLEWMERHKEEPDITLVDEEDILRWDKNFLDLMGHKRLFEILMAANYLDVQGLYQHASKIAADYVKTICADKEHQRLFPIDRNRDNLFGHSSVNSPPNHYF